MAEIGWRLPIPWKARFSARTRRRSGSASDIAQIFMVNLPAAGVRERSAAEGIDALLVSDADPVWAERSSWVWRTRPLYADTHLRLLAVTDVAEEKTQ